ncbi:MAG: hypothetical protein IKQ40_05110 [Lachnospiraceae bacterium]|nr:hypothetical protein [Lachnospiraceae bacterium]
MVAIALVAAAALAVSLIFNRKLYETLPVGAFIATLTVYVLALVLPLTAAVYICACIVAAALLFFMLRLRKDEKKAPGSFWGGHLQTLRYFFVPVIVCAVFCALFANRRVFFYDDLSYWALYTKNIFAIDKLPHLFENCSVDYKDYTPVIQILQYIAMFGRATFSEPDMYRTNVCLIYILLLPLLFAGDKGFAGDKEFAGNKAGDAAGGKRSSGKGRKITLSKAASVILYIIFPHILTSQFYFRLGVDLLLALVFGYILFYIFVPDDHDAFTMLTLACGLSFLALIKTSGIVLCLLAVIMFAVRRMFFSGEASAVSDLKRQGANTTGAVQKNPGAVPKDTGKSRLPAVIQTFLLLVFSVGAYLSWQLFLHYSWNKGYLSDRVKAGVSGAGFSFPEYTGEVVANYIKHFFVYPLTRNAVGVTAAVLVLFIAAVYVTGRVAGRSAKGHTAGAENTAGASNAGNAENTASGSRFGTAAFVMVMAGLLIFMTAHLSMYLFVFDEWEAHGLAEFDRYITQYLGGAFFLYACMLLRMNRAGAKAASLLMYVSLAVFIALLPYRDMKHYLVPDEYDAMFESEYARISENAADEWKASGIDELNLAHDGTQRVTVVADAWDDTMQFIEYAAVPQPINRIVNAPAAEPGRICGYIMDFVDEYVYVCNNAPASYNGDWEETKAITTDGSALRAGVLYKVIGSGEDKLLESM